MNEKSLKILEYNKITDKLQEFAGSALGRELCAQLKPASDIDVIRRLQNETTDALNRIYKKGSLSFSGIPDIRASIMRLEIESTLGAGELMHIGSALTATLRTKNYGRTIGVREDTQEEYTDSLSERFNLLEPMSDYCHEIERCIISEEEIADDASPGLKSVRRSMKLTNDKIHEKLNSIITSSGSKTVLQDSLITMRDGRYCVPVKSEYRGQFAGMVHDQSSSGSTLFIEPMEVVKLNNELRQLAIRENEEIEKVLYTLSSQFFGRTEDLKFNIKTLTEFDFIFARAALSKSMKASEPEFNQNGELDIRKGRHPLIDAKKVVPIDIRLGKDFNLLVITGPNTGGKTVSLKTVGLFVLMGQSGLHIPALDGSKLPVYDNVFADIGDEQSIEQSLSTFSAHMTNTVSILKEADEHSLVLFDELGAGTDPTEGAALAMAILTYLHNKDIHGMATTHYSELKVYALTTPGVSNACCEFDVATLRPTYRLLIGIPGKSNAFAISSKLGLSEDIIAMADSFIGTKDKSFEDVLSELDEKRVKIENNLAEAQMLKLENEELKKKLTAKNEKLDAVKDRIIREANEQAREILQEAKDFADDTIRKYNKWSSSGAGREMELERNALRERLGEKNEALSIKTRVKKKDHEAGEFHVGDSVIVLSLNLQGKVSTAPNAKGDLYVQMGALRSLVNIKDLELTEDKSDEGNKKTRTQAGKIGASKAMTISTECNVIGKRVDEALPVVEKYLDDAYLSHLARVTIIHGRGTGALRDAVHGMLKRVKYVKSYRLGGFGEGDGGVTIVEFKE